MGSRLVRIQRDALPDNFRPLVTFLCYTGCRLGAAKKTTWDMVNADATEITLPKDIIKNRTPLILFLVGEGLKEVSAEPKKMFRKDGPVFDATNLRWAWAEACATIGVGKFDKKHRKYEGLKIHDLRRSAARNLRKAKGARRHSDENHRTQDGFGVPAIRHH